MYDYTPLMISVIILVPLAAFLENMDYVSTPLGLWASQRYKNVVTAKEMFQCQLLVWSQLAVSLVE